ATLVQKQSRLKEIMQGKAAELPTEKGNSRKVAEPPRKSLIGGKEPENSHHAWRRKTRGSPGWKISAPGGLSMINFSCGSPRGPAAVDQEVGAGDEACVLQAQVQGQFADFLDLTPTSQGNTGNELLIQFRIL